MLLVCAVAGWCRTFLVCELMLVVVLLFLAVYQLVLIVCLEIRVVVLAVVLVLSSLVFCLWICNVIKCWCEK